MFCLSFATSLLKELEESLSRLIFLTLETELWTCLMSQGSAPFLNLRLVWNTSPGRLLLCLITTSSLFMSYVPGAWKRALHCKEGPQFVFLHSQLSSRYGHHRGELVGPGRFSISGQSLDPFSQNNHEMGCIQGTAHHFGYWNWKSSGVKGCGPTVLRSLWSFWGVKSLVELEQAIVYNYVKALVRFELQAIGHVRNPG